MGTELFPLLPLGNCLSTQLVGALLGFLNSTESLSVCPGASEEQAWQCWAMSSFPVEEGGWCGQHPLLHCWKHLVPAALETPWLGQKPGNSQPEGAMTASPHRRESRCVTQQPEGLKVAATKLFQPDVVTTLENVEMDLNLVWMQSRSKTVRV